MRIKDECLRKVCATSRQEPGYQPDNMDLLIRQILLIVTEIEEKTKPIKLPNKLEEFRDIFIK
jgi:hypothetical protein